MKPSSRGLDIVAFSGTRIWSRIIRLRSRSRYSHVGLICEIDGDDWVIEALEGKGVRVVPLRVWFSWNGEVTAFALDASDSAKQGMIDFAKARIGQEYASPWQFVRSWGVITRALCRWLGIRRDLEADRWFCSELVAAALESVGLRLVEEVRGYAYQLTPSEMTPGDVCNLPYMRPIVEISR